jgi:hypothetical protein
MPGRGPLGKPAAQRRRRNKPTIPTRSLPAGGFAGPYPRLPKGVELGEAGRIWWRWAWRTPQAAAWDAGTHVALARRASLEDDLAALERVDGIDVGYALSLVREGEARKAIIELEWVVRNLARLAGGKLAVCSKMLDLDRQFGLTTRSFYDLHFEIVPDVEAKPEPAATGEAPSGPRRLRAVDPSALAGA